MTGEEYAAWQAKWERRYIAALFHPNACINLRRYLQHITMTEEPK